MADAKDDIPTFSAFFSLLATKNGPIYARVFLVLKWIVIMVMIHEMIIVTEKNQLK